MTTLSAPVSPADLLDEIRALPRRPAEGWTTVGLVILLALPAAWSIDDARWVLGKSELTGFLPWMAALGVLWGFASAKAGWSRWVAHLVGAGLAAVIVPIAVGTILLPGTGSIGDWYHASASSAVEAYLDLAVRGKALTQQYGHFLLVLGLFCWGTGQFAGYSVFGRKRPMNAIAVSGLALLVNMSITSNEQLGFLVVFTLAALLLLIRLHALEERASWLRRRIGDPATVASLYLRGGSIFVGATVVGALFLTASASSAPLAGAFSDLDQRIVDFSEGFQRFLPHGGPGTRISGVSFGPSTSISGRWVTDGTRALSIQVAPNDSTRYYWRAVTYDRFDLDGWSYTDTSKVNRAPDSALLDDIAEDPSKLPGYDDVNISITPLEYRGSTVFSPGIPIKTSRATHLELVGPGQYLGGVVSDGGGDRYTVEAAVPKVGDVEGGLTENRLRAAGTDYPADITRLYTSVPDGSIGPNARQLLSTVEEQSRAQNPYDLAKAMVTYMHPSTVFHYNTDVSGIPCNGESVVECFARIKQGYCQYYASTMAILLRVAHIPTRYVQGFLPGDRDPRTGVETILLSNSHAWVEVYFPNYGWVPFDPTGGGVAQLAAIPSGKPVPSTRPSIRPTSGNGDNGPDPRRSLSAGAGGTTSSGGSSPGSASLIIVALLLVVAVLGLGFIAWQRGPRGTVHPDSVYRGITRLAGRFGYGPTPTQTVYEYAGALGEVLPVARPELEVVATAKVEVAYGRRLLGEDRLTALRLASRRLRVSLLRLAFLRRPRIRRGEGTAGPSQTNGS